jgi:hypothetical protein
MNRNFILLLFGFSGITLLCRCKDGISVDMITGNWVNLSSFVTRSEAVVFVIGNYAYVATGIEGNGMRAADCWQYDPQLDQWVQKANFPGAPRNSAVAFCIGNLGYLGTGYDGHVLLNDFWAYNPSSNSWTEKADFAGGPRSDAVGFGIANDGYISTGYDGTRMLRDCWQYDPGTDAWSQKQEVKLTPRSAAVSFVYNNKAYIVTGMNKDTAVTDFWVFDPGLPDSSGWYRLRSIANVSTESYDDAYTTIARWNAVAFTMLGTESGDRAFITTGENGPLTSLTWAYDFTTDLWYERTPFEGGARTGAIGFTVQNRGFAGLGNSGSTFDSDIREFYPDEIYNPND